MVSKNGDNKELPEKVSEEHLQQLSLLIARLIQEVELAHEIVKELAKHLGVSKEEWEQILQKAYSNLRNRLDEIAQIYIGEDNSK